MPTSRPAKSKPVSPIFSCARCASTPGGSPAAFIVVLSLFIATLSFLLVSSSGVIATQQFYLQAMSTNRTLGSVQK